MDDDDAIAIVGVGGKFPGADNINEFWKILVNGENHVTEIPKDRWNMDAYYDQDQDAPGKTYVHKAGLLSRYDEFDNKMFGISDIEAHRLDPQQRYVLECVHMALEDGGIPSAAVNGTETGVFIGVMNDDYKEMASDDLTTATNYSLTGASRSLISARVSYVYNLLGPSMGIDTACSSSLVAVDIGIQNIKTGRCSMAICGGVNSLITPDIFIPLSRARMISPTGQCQAFSANADGYCRGEGCGIVILKRLGEAKKDKNKIWATIATCCNQDGHTATPITAPSSIQQEKLLKQIYSENKVDPATIQVIEAHGTGTPVGDPVEINTLGRFFMNAGHKTMNEPKYIASVKTNIGHLESAAGAASLIKVLLMMKNKTIVPSLHFSTPNPQINFQKYRFEVPTASMRWKKPSAGCMMACSNCFGFGGTNSHAIIKHFDDERNDDTIQCNANKHLVFLSSNQESELANTLQTFIEDITTNRYNVCDMSYTSLCRRDHLSSRVAIFTENLEDLLSKVREKKQIVMSHHLEEFKSPRVIAVFCGVGTVWKGMCRDLLGANSIFRDAVHRIDNVLQQFCAVSVYDTFMNGREITDPFTGHLAIFTCQIGLWVLWRHYGLEIDAVVGQSVGEVAASYAAGCLTLEDAVKVIYLRSSLLAGVTGGKMLAIGNCKRKYVEAACSKYIRKANVAVYSSTTSSVIACDADIVDEITQSIRNYVTPEERNCLFFKDLNVQCAYHSPHTENAGVRLEQALQNLQVHSPIIEVLSSVTGMKADENTFSPSYWKRNVTNPVLFKSVIVEAGHPDKFNIFLEIGPKPALRMHLLDSYSPHEAVCLSSMEVKDNSAMLKSAGKMFEYKVNLDWKTISCQGNVCDVPRIPLHPTFKGIYMSDTSLLKLQGLEQNKGSHLFVSRTHSKDAMFRITITEKKTPFVFHHFVGNEMVVPGAFFAEVCLEVVKTVKGGLIQDFGVKIDFLHLMQLVSKKTYHADVLLNRSSKHCVSGVIKRGNESIAFFESKILEESFQREAVNVEVLKNECQEMQTAESTYDLLRLSGFSYGADIKVLGNAIKNETQCLVEMHVPDEIWNDVTTTNFHPAILDGLLQTPGVLQLSSYEKDTLLPAGIECLIVRKRIERNMLGYAEIAYRSRQYTLYNLALIGRQGTIIAEVKGYKIKNVTESMKDQSLDYNVKWELADFQSISVRNKSNIMLCTFNKDIIVSFPDVLSECFKVSTVVIKDETVSQLKSLMQKVFVENEVTQILFIPGFQMNDTMSGKDIFRKSMATCSFMLATVQAIEAGGNYIPVTIVTECTQACDVNTCTRINLCGSELWGQVRSFLREDSMLDMIIVDCRPSIKESSIFIDKILKDRPKGVGEFVVENGKVFSNFLTRSTTYHIPKHYKDSTLDGTCKIKLKAKHQDSLKDAYLEIDNPFRKINDELKSYELIDVVCKHSPTTVQTLSQDSFSLYGDMEFGLDVIAYEATAKKTSGMNTISTDQIPDCVILYPMTVKSIVSVPPECVYPLDELPGYKTGILLKAVLMYALSCKFGPEQTAFVVHDENNKPSAKLLGFFLEIFHKCQVTLETDLGSSPRAIIIKPVNKYDLRKIPSFGSLKSILTLSTFITPNQRRLLEMKGVNVDYVEIESVLNQRFLKSFNLIIRKHLRFQLDKIAITFDESGHFQGSVKRNHFDSTISLRPTDLKQFGVVKLPKELLVRKDCSYVVIGGLTGLGWQIMRLLATSGAGEVISISRRNPNADIEAEMANIGKESGCNVRSLSADIADWDGTVKVFETIDKTTTLSVKGIFQGAGVLKDTLSLYMTQDDLAEVLQPKILGSWNLHLISKKYNLDYFVLHSSVTSVLGNIGQSNYAAGNSFLDSLAQYRRTNNLHGQSINWGPLSLGMMTNVPNATMIEELLREKGYISLDVNDICQSLLNAMINDEAQVVIGDFDWKLVGKSLSKVTNSEIRYKLRKLISKSDRFLINANQHTLFESNCLVELSGDITKETILEMVLKIASEAFIHDIEHIKTSIPIGEFGIDSMQVMTFANKIHEVFGIRIALVKFMSEETTFDSIAKILYSKIKEDKPSILLDELVGSRTPLSPILWPFFNDHIHHPNNPVLTVFADLELTQTVADPKLWKLIFTWLHTKYPTLRTSIEANEDRSEVTKIVLGQEKIKVDFRVVKMKDLEMEKKYPSHTKTLIFDPTKDLPMRVLFANDSEKCILRLVLNHMFFDFASIGTLINELRSFYLSRKPPNNTDIVSIDMYQVYHKRLAETRSQMTNFWNNKIPKQAKTMTLNASLKTNLDPTRIETVNITISKAEVEMIQNAMKLHKIKLSDLIASLYHVLLWQQIQAEDIVFFLVVDLRIHFPDLKSHVGCFGNPVPIFAKVRPEMTLLNLIKSNGQMILNAVENSLLPNRDIVGIIEDKTSCSVYQHRMTMEYLREFDESLDRFKNIRVKRIVSTRHTLQTNLFVWNNLEKNFLKLDLVYNSAVVHKDHAMTMLDNIRHMILALIENPKVTIAEISDIHPGLAMTGSESHVKQKKENAQMEIKTDLGAGRLEDGRGVRIDPVNK